MARYYEQTTLFNFSWEQVASGYWRRYPNPLSSHVLTEDTVQRVVRDGRLYTKRLLTKTNRVPKWGERFFNAKSVKIVEESIVDPERKLLITYTRNLGYTKVMSVVERVEYTPAASGAGAGAGAAGGAAGAGTVCRRAAWVDSQVFGFSRAIRAFGLDRFKKNCSQMVAGFNHVLHALFAGAAGAGAAPPAAGAPLGQALKEMRDAAAGAAGRAKANVLHTVQRS